MRSTGTFLAALMVCALLARPAAADIVIDFETDDDGNALHAGDILTTQYSDYFTVSSWGGPAMIFDSAHPTGGDTDLGTPNSDFGGPGIGSGGKSGEPGENAVGLDNVLIISEDGDASDPDDDAGGGAIKFYFKKDVTIDSVQILDIDNEHGGFVKLYTRSGRVKKYMLDLGNNSFQRIDFGVDDVYKMKVYFPSSGAIAGFSFRTPTPEPGTLVLAGCAVAGLVWHRRRRRKPVA